jgi:5-methylcytosine-specific restriction enzyme subunit McrC
MRVIKVFEHQLLRTDMELFTEAHFDALARFNERHGNKYCSFLHKAVRFKSYVGVIQLGNLSIEILPKTDQRAGDTDYWQAVLLDLLQHCQLLQIDSFEEAELRLQKGSLYQLYLHHFLDEIAQLLKKGLLKTYSKKTVRSKHWKGKVNLSKQLLLTAKGQSECHSSLQQFDTNHIWHQLIYQALKVLDGLNLDTTLDAKFNKIRNLFPEQSPIAYNAETFERLSYNSKTLGYKRVMNLTALVLLNYSPLLSAGRFPVLGILFDMNRLFEEYIYRQLLKAMDPDWTIERQASGYFWAEKTYCPDIVLRYKTQPLVIDCKWKQLLTPNPEDNDLRQIFVYQSQLGAKEGWLLYPAVGTQDHFLGKFHRHDEREAMSARVVWASVIDKESGRLNKNLGKELLELAIQGF